jgi:hypothetical protein
MRRRAKLALLRAVIIPKDKILSAVVRVKNEEEFLFPSVASIANLVEEIVIVDNMSTDKTLEIIDDLRQEYPDKVVAYRYPFPVARAGTDNAEVLAEEGPTSPHLLANHMNWCVKRCSKPYILKWDGDMIATERFYDSVERWRSSDKVIVFHRGANVHPDLEHLVGAVDKDPERFESLLTLPDETLPDKKAIGLAKLVSRLTYTADEPLVFPRFLTRHTPGPWSEELRTPFLKKRLFTHREATTTFLHLKFCKSNPYANMSDDFEEMVRSNVTLGPKLSQRSRAQLHARLALSGTPDNQSITTDTEDEHHADKPLPAEESNDERSSECLNRGTENGL